ncbi:MAG: CoA transferase [Phenylobacterium sp.]
MSPLAAAVEALSAEIAAGSRAVTGQAVRAHPEVLTERARLLGLAEPGRRSANGSCRMVRAADSWLAVNLPRESDLDAVPAWLGAEVDDDPWETIEDAARTQSAERLVEDAQRLGMPVARVGEIKAATARAPLLRMGAGGARGKQRLRVVDLSSLWAGPLCGGLLSEAGADVVKIESTQRPDTLAASSPDFFARLNGGKTCLALDFSEPADLARLADDVAGADVLITGARPRAFVQLGLASERVFAANPGLVWVAITGYGWTGPLSARVAFGDDAAAAGGLVAWDRDEPGFLGDALADPFTGLAAAAAAFRALEQGGGLLADVAMARTAAGVAAGLTEAVVA